MRVIERWIAEINDILWHEYFLYFILGVGVLFTIWSRFCQYHALTHGVTCIRGKYDDPRDPGAISHFQALATALSGTVGLGNIAGVAMAVALGGPGAVFWMWMVGIAGMALKTTEVTLAMLYRNTDNPGDPHGGPMWVALRGFERWGLKPLGAVIGGVFCIALLIGTITGGNMFQAWNVAEITVMYFPAVPRVLIGIVIAVLVGLTVIGGIKRIGAVSGRLAPFMCVLYLLGALYVLAVNFRDIPGMLMLIFRSAFSPTDAGGAFLGGTVGSALLWGMKRALFSNEAGQGSSPMAHAAARTNEPVREGIVAGLEPFVDTIVVCTLTALVVLSSGAWNREAAATFADPPRVVPVDGRPGVWTLDPTAVPNKTPEADRTSGQWRANDSVFALVAAHRDASTGQPRHQITGSLRTTASGDLEIIWDEFQSETTPTLLDPGLHLNLVGAALAGHAFDRVAPGLGMWIVTASCWLFAVSTIISWCYYGEQGVVFLVGSRGVLAYKLVYCALIVVSTLEFVKTEKQLDDWTTLGTGVMLVANIPITLIFGSQAMSAYRGYIRRLRLGEFDERAGRLSAAMRAGQGQRR